MTDGGGEEVVNMDGEDDSWTSMDEVGGESVDRHNYVGCFCAGVEGMAGDIEGCEEEASDKSCDVKLVPWPTLEKSSSAMLVASTVSLPLPRDSEWHNHIPQAQNSFLGSGPTISIAICSTGSGTSGTLPILFPDTF